MGHHTGHSEGKQNHHCAWGGYGQGMGGINFSVGVVSVVGLVKTGDVYFVGKVMWVVDGVKFVVRVTTLACNYYCLVVYLLVLI